MNTMQFYYFVDIGITCIESFFLWYLLQSKEKVTSSKQKVFYFYFLLTFSVVLMTTIDLGIPVKALIILIILIFIGKKIYELSMSSLLLYGILYLILALCSELIVIQLWDLFDNNPITMINGNKQSFIIELSILTKAMNFGIIIIAEKLQKSNKEALNLKDILPYIVSSIASITVLCCIYVNLIYVEDEKYIIGFLISSILILLSFIYNTISTNRYIEEKRIEQIEKISLYEHKIKSEYFQEKLKDEEKIRMIYHDFKNHLLILENENYKSQGDNILIKELKSKISIYEDYYNTGNEFLDIILKEKIKTAKEKNIRVDLFVNFESGSFILPLDISTIFGNLFDNAIEACERLDSSDRYILLKVLPQNGLLVISIKNSIRFDIENLDISRTTKEDKLLHGFGIKNIKKSIARYNGESSITVDKGVFNYSIVIPLKIKNKNGVIE